MPRGELDNSVFAWECRRLEFELQLDATFVEGTECKCVGV